MDDRPCGLGAVLSHKVPHGTRKQVTLPSTTLSHAEKSYAQIEKEVLAIIFGLKIFHFYLYGNKFTLVTDHQH